MTTYLPFAKAVLVPRSDLGRFMHESAIELAAFMWINPRWTANEKLLRGTATGACINA